MNTADRLRSPVPPCWGAARPVLAAGRYLLIVGEGERLPEVGVAAGAGQCRRCAGLDGWQRPVIACAGIFGSRRGRLMTAATIAALLEQALQSVPGGFALRVERAGDFASVCALYAEFRREELAPVAWPDQAKRDFLDAQCRLQHDHYVANYPGAELLVIVQAAQVIGRIYVHATSREIRLMEIALRERHRNGGIGSALLAALQGEAERRNIPLTLHVEPGNPAQRMYRRMGFRLIENRGVYDFLGWSASAGDQLNTASN